jgi:hypothetical protein
MRFPQGEWSRVLLYFAADGKVTIRQLVVAAAVNKTMILHSRKESQKPILNLKF